MGDLTRNLSRHEFACKCGCGFDTVDFELVNVLQDAVFHFESKYGNRVIVSITGPNRCIEHNRKEGGAEGSKHITGKAADHKFFIVSESGSRKQIDPVEVYDYYCHKYPNKFGIGIYSNRVHIDSRSGKGRWDAR